MYSIVGWYRVKQKRNTTFAELNPTLVPHYCGNAYCGEKFWRPGNKARCMASIPIVSLCPAAPPAPFLWERFEYKARSCVCFHAEMSLQNNYSSYWLHVQCLLRCILSWFPIIWHAASHAVLLLFAQRKFLLAAHSWKPFREWVGWYG